VSRPALFTADSFLDVANANATLDLTGSIIGINTLTKTGAGRFDRVGEQRVILQRVDYRQWHGRHRQTSRSRARASFAAVASPSRRIPARLST